MRIGLTSIFAFRPHVEHLIYLADLLRAAGHDVRFFSCDAAADVCYNKLLKGQGRLKGCGPCFLGGLHSYGARPHFSASSSYRMPLDDDRAQDIAKSSSYTLHRVESPSDLELPEVLATQRELRSSIETIYGSARRWIREERLDAVLIFNGRMDLTRAVMDAAKDAGCLFATVERPWFGNGIQFNPGENCIGLKDPLGLIAEYRDKPLTKAQALLAAKILALRFAKKNILEWRQFNVDAVKAFWPLKATPKVLFTPGSRSESAGHPDFSDPFQNDIARTVDRIMEKLGLSAGNLVMRCHPIWNQKIGRQGGEKARRYYEGWAKERGIFMYAADSNVDTYDLMREADLVIVTGGSTGVESSALGKKVISINPSFYSGAGFALDVKDEKDLAAVPRWEDFRLENPERQVLRFIYLFASRYPQFVDFARAKTPLDYGYRPGADAQRIIDLLKTGRLQADDPSVAADDREESDVVARMKAWAWGELAEHPDPQFADLSKIQRSFAFRWVDGMRGMFPPGDRW